MFPINYLISIDIIPLEGDKLKQKLEINNKVINKQKLPTIFNNEFVEYNKMHKNKYNEIFKFLKTNIFEDKIYSIEDKEGIKKDIISRKMFLIII